MAQLIADRRDIDFILHEQFELSQLSRHGIYTEFNKTVIDMILTEAKNLAVKEILPTNKTGDREGCRYENGTVSVPAVFKSAWKLLEKGQWFAPSQNSDWGGQGIPETLNVMAQNYLIGANMALLMVAGLNHAAGSIIEKFGSSLQKKQYLNKLYSGEWGGTMLLTEADSGSNLGDLKTIAVKNSDGTYSLFGDKVFISGGDHDMTENIVHLVLARIEGAPAGSRGISLFAAPKIRTDDDGRLLEPNDIICTGIEEKMGLHGSPTCSMSLGSRKNCIATLIGEENKGLSIMFLMMNKARLMTGAQGLACASSAYMQALTYARSRIQGTLPSDKNREFVPIIRHPDIRRMLLTMKMYTEGMRSLLCYIAHLEDQKKVAGSPADQDRYQDLIDILIPVAKGYVTDRAVDVCNLAIQVFGGYGYTSEFPVEQLLRDVRITTIYEGTNGIQAIDFLSRKISIKKGKLFLALINEIKKTIDEAKAIESLEKIAQKVDLATEKLKKTVSTMVLVSNGPNHLVPFAWAAPLLEAGGDVTMAWMLLWRAKIASTRLEQNIKKKDMAFYTGQIKSAEFFISSILPVTMGKMVSIMDLCSAAIEISDASFGG